MCAAKDALEQHKGGSNQLARPGHSAGAPDIPASPWNTRLTWPAAGFTREGNRPKWTPLCRGQCTDAEGQCHMMGPPQRHIPLNSINFYNFDSFKRADCVCSQEYTIHFVIGLTGNRIIPSTLKQHRFF